MEQKINNGPQKDKVSDLYSRSKHWESELRFITDELKFIKHLLNSYVFEPNTPNLFERLQDYQDQLLTISGLVSELQERITRHEKELGGMLECTDDLCDTDYHKQHTAIEVAVDQCLDRFRTLKVEIFNYAGGILRQRKPDTMP